MGMMRLAGATTLFCAFFISSNEAWLKIGACRAMLSSLEQHSSESFVVLRVLLTLKNCIRCQSRTIPVNRWLLADAMLFQAIKRIATDGRKGSSASLTLSSGKGASNNTHDQITKAASDIVRLCQSSSAS